MSNINEVQHQRPKSTQVRVCVCVCPYVYYILGTKRINIQLCQL